MGWNWDNDPIVKGVRAGEAWMNDPVHGSTPFEQAHQQLNLNTQEKALYQRHLDNLNGPGKVSHPDGSISTLYQMSITGDNGRIYNIPSVYDGKILEGGEAVQRAKSIGLDSFPSYGSTEEAEARYQQMHEYMDKDVGLYRNGPKPEPSYPAVAGNAAAKAVAGLPDSFIHAATPRFLRSDATQEPVRKGFEHIGLINAENEPQTMGQRILDMAVQTGVGTAIAPASGPFGVAKNVVSGLLSGTLGGVTKEATGSDLAATAVSMGTGVATNRLFSTKANAPTLRNPVKLQTAKEGMAAGYVVPPSHIKPSYTTNKIESMAGKAAIEQEAAVRNQDVTNKLAAKSIGLPEDTILDHDILDAVRKEAGKAYEKLRALVPGKELQNLKVSTIEDRPMLPGPVTGLKVSKVQGDPLATGLNVQELRDEEGLLRGMKIRTASAGQEPGALEGMTTSVTSRGQDVPGALQGLKVRVAETRGTSPVDELKQVREDAKANYKENTAKGKRRGDVLMARAKEIEDQLEQSAIKSGNQELIAEFRAARTQIAKTHVLERALNEGDGNIDAHKIASMLKNEQLTGELDVIARFARAFKKSTRTTSTVPSPGVSGTDPAMAAGLATIGYGAAGGPVGTVVGGLPLLRGPARSGLLSGMYQKRLLQEPPELNQALLRSILAGRATAEA